jgi:hypothetical protein
MHELGFIPALHQDIDIDIDINDNRISGAVLLPSGKRRFFSAKVSPGTNQHFSESPGYPDHWRKAKFEDSGRVARDPAATQKSMSPQTGTHT